MNDLQTTLAQSPYNKAFAIDVDDNNNRIMLIVWKLSYQEFLLYYFVNNHLEKELPFTNASQDEEKTMAVRKSDHEAFQRAGYPNVKRLHLAIQDFGFNPHGLIWSSPINN